MAAGTPERCSSPPLHHSPQTSVHPEGVPNDDVYCVFMTDLGCLPPFSPFGASASSAAVGTGYIFIYFFAMSETHSLWKCMACTLPVLLLLFSAPAHYLSLLSLSLYIFYIAANTLSVPQYQ